MKRLLFYNDSAVMGGHEFMTVELVSALGRLGAYDIHMLFYNELIGTTLPPGVGRHRLPFATATPLPFVRNLNPIHISHVERLIRQLSPDMVVISQGNIEIGLKGLIAARGAGCRTVSYLPLAYTFSEMGSRFGKVRDIVDRLYYRLPHGCIVEAPYQAALLRRLFQGVIQVIPYPLVVTAPTDLPTAPTPMIRAGINIGIIGRVYFRHKNQDILPKVAVQLQSRGIAAVFHILGDGPDLSRLQALVATAGVDHMFQFHGWMAKQQLHGLVARSIDVVLIPSHFEGIPLVMLESLALGKPILVSRLDFVPSYGIPAKFLIDPHDPSGIADKLVALCNETDNSDTARLRDTVLQEHAQPRFEQAAKEAFRNLERV